MRDSAEIAQVRVDVEREVRDACAKQAEAIFKSRRGE